MRKNLLLMVLCVIMSALSSCSSSSDDNEDIDNGRNSGEKLIVGKWIPYTWDGDDYSFLEDVGWLQINSNKTFTMYAYDKTLMLKGNWELAETSDAYENKTLQLSIDGWGKIWQEENPHLSKKEIDDNLIGGKFYFIIEDLFSNYMKTVRFLFIYPNGQTEQMTTKLEWRRE